MAKRPGARRVEEFAFFNVLYEDGTQTPNRKVPCSELDGIGGDVPAKPYIEGTRSEDRRDVRETPRPDQIPDPRQSTLERLIT